MERRIKTTEDGETGHISRRVRYRAGFHGHVIAAPMPMGLALDPGLDGSSVNQRGGERAEALKLMGPRKEIPAVGIVLWLPRSEVLLAASNGDRRWRARRPMAGASRERS